MTTPDPHAWTLTAAYRLGRHWQGTGDYVRAYAAYADAHRRSGKHAPTLYNLAVVAVRLGFYGAATESLDELCRLRKFPVRLIDSAEWRHDYLPIAYQRALIRDYEGRYDAAAEWSRALAERVENDSSAHQMLGLPALILHAGTTIRGYGSPARSEATAHAVIRAVEAETLDEVEPPDAKVPDLDDPAAIFAYVRGRAGADTRTHYNLACFLGRLASLTPDHAGKLAELAVGEVQQAMSDAHLIEWAKRDPALEEVRTQLVWAELMQRVDPSAAPEAPADVATTAPEPPETAPESRPRARRSPRDAVIDRATGILREVCAVDIDPRGLRALESLRGLAGDLSARRFAIELAAAVAAAGDPGTVYHLPGAGGGETMALPFALAEVGRERRQIVVAEGDAGVPAGAELTHWNGVPIDDALDLRAERIAGATGDARRARALASLTHRPPGLLEPFDEDEVTLRWRDESDITYRWQPVGRESSPSPARQPWSIDPLVEALQLGRGEPPAVDPPERVQTDDVAAVHLRVRTFAVPGEDLTDAMLSELPKRSGLVLDLRGNPGGSVASAARLLAALGVDMPAHAERRRTAAARRLVNSLALPSAGYSEVSLDLPERGPQLYFGPVVLLVDGLCAGAAALFARQFERVGRGLVVSPVPRPGLTTGLTARVGGELMDGGGFSTTFARFAGLDRPFAPSATIRPETVDGFETVAAAAQLLRARESGKPS